MFGPFALVVSRIAILLGFHRKETLFTESESAEIVSAIAQAELTTSAEIRVHISHKFKGDTIVAAAAETFAKLGMHKTAERNGILIFWCPIQSNLPSSAMRASMPKWLPAIGM